MFYVRTIYKDSSCAYRLLRHVLHHSAAKSEKETSQLARNGGGIGKLCGHGAAMSTIIWLVISKLTPDALYRSIASDRLIIMVSFDQY